MSGNVIRPFDTGNWFAINNAIFDVVMPSLSPNAWKILCVAIRQTWGWVADPDGDPKERKEWDQISYSQFRDRSGIASDATVRKALEECFGAGYLLRRQVGTYRGKPAYAYALNRDYEIELPTSTETVEVTGTGVPTSTETVEVTSTETVTVDAPTATETVDTKQNINKTNKGTAAADLQVKELLANEGMNEPNLSALAQTCSLALVKACVEYRQLNPELGVGWLVEQLRTGELPASGHGGASTSSIAGMQVYGPETR